MIEEVIRDAALKQIMEAFPHIMIAASMEARITGVKELGTYDIEDLKITNEDEDETFNATITAKKYEYTLKILNRHGGEDENFPVVPKVKSRIQVKEGAKVAVIMLYGETRPFLVGEVP